MVLLLLEVLFDIYYQLLLGWDFYALCRSTIYDVQQFSRFRLHSELCYGIGFAQYWRY